MHRHQLTDEQWSIVEPLIPKKNARTGRPPAEPRAMLDGILWILRTGAPWRDLPERFGPCKTVFDYYSHWRRSGVFDRIVEALQIRLDREGKIDWDLWCIDGSHVRAARWLKECRRIVTRFEKLAVSYLGMLKLAMIDRYMRMLEFSDRA